MDLASHPPDSERADLSAEGGLVIGKDVIIGLIKAEKVLLLLFRKPPGVVGDNDPGINRLSQFCLLSYSAPGTLNPHPISLGNTAGTGRFRMNNGPGVGMKTSQTGDLPSPGMPVEC